MRWRCGLHECQKSDYMDDCRRLFSRGWKSSCYDLSLRQLLRRLIKGCLSRPRICPRLLDSTHSYNKAFCEPSRFYWFLSILFKLANSNQDMGSFHHFYICRYQLMVNQAIHMLLAPTISTLLILMLFIDSWATVNFGISFAIPPTQPVQIPKDEFLDQSPKFLPAKKSLR